MSRKRRAVTRYEDWTRLVAETWARFAAAALTGTITEQQGGKQWAHDRAVMFAEKLMEKWRARFLHLEVDALASEIVDERSEDPMGCPEHQLDAIGQWVHCARQAEGCEREPYVRARLNSLPEMGIVPLCSSCAAREIRLLQGLTEIELVNPSFRVAGR